MENDDDENRFVAGNVLIFQTWHWTSCNGTYILCNVNAETTYRTALKQSVGRKRKKKKRWPDDSACLDKNSGAQQTSEFILCGTESMNQKSFQSLKSYQDELIIKVHHLGIIHICSKVVVDVGILPGKWKVWPAGGARWNVRGSPKFFMVHPLKTLNVTVWNVMMIHRIAATWVWLKKKKELQPLRLIRLSMINTGNNLK